MRKPNLLILFSGILLVACERALYADLVPLDWQVQGDGLLTLDTDSGLAWFQLEPTLNRSFGDVSSNLEPGGDFFGLRYATEFEFLELLSNIGVTDFNPKPENREPLQQFQQLVGISNSSTANTFSLGIFSDPAVAAFDRRGANVFTTDTIGAVFFDDQPNGPAINLGSWLLSTRSVPEPNSILIIAFLATFYGISRRHRFRHFDNKKHSY